MFLLDLFSGVVFFQYGKELDKDASLSALNCTQEQINWIMIQKLLRGVTPSYTFLKEPKNWFRKPFFHLTTRPWFENLMYGVILVDTLRLGMVFTDMPDYWVDVLIYANFICTGVFFVEGTSMVIAHKKRVFRIKWTFVELIVLLCSSLCLQRFGRSFFTFCRTKTIPINISQRKTGLKTLHRSATENS